MSLPALTRRFFTRSVHCIDSDYFPAGVEATRALPERMDWGRAIPFILLHLGCLGVIWVGWSPVAVVVCALLYVIRMFFVPGIYHRYFCHKAYKASRPVQFLFALIGLLCVQFGLRSRQRCRGVVGCGLQLGERLLQRGRGLGGLGIRQAALNPAAAGGPGQRHLVSPYRSSGAARISRFPGSGV